jgi:hypothetical protein
MDLVSPRSARFPAGLLALLLLAGCGDSAPADQSGPGSAATPGASGAAAVEQDELPAPEVASSYVAEVEALAGQAPVQEALAYLERIEPRSLDELIRLTEIPAPPFMEEERAAAFAEMLREAGADSVWIDGIGNVLGLRRGTVGDRTVAVDAHLDTVFPIETDVTVQSAAIPSSLPGSATTRGDSSWSGTSWRPWRPMTSGPRPTSSSSGPWARKASGTSGGSSTSSAPTA